MGRAHAVFVSFLSLKVFAAQSKKSRLMNFLNTSFAVVALIELTVLNQLFFIVHEKGHLEVL